jgi:hypothetical protein
MQKSKDVQQSKITENKQQKRQVQHTRDNSITSMCERLGPGDGPDAGWSLKDPNFIPYWPYTYFKTLTLDPTAKGRERVLIEYKAFCRLRDQILAKRKQ